MSGGTRLKPIDTIADIAEGIAALRLIDQRLEPVIELAGDIPLRRAPPGFAALASVVIGQQVSRSAADAILARLVAGVDPLTPARVLEADDAVFRAAGLSAGKVRTLRAVAAAAEGGMLDLPALGERPHDAAIAALTALPGIGPWTAEVYLLVSVGHPDIFPAGDVALQAAVGHAFGIDPRPDARRLAAIAESWAPWRSVAARLFWAYYRGMRGREAAPAA